MTSNNNDFVNGEGKNTSLEKTIANSEILPTNDDAVKDTSPDAPVFPDGSEQSTYSKEIEDTSGDESDAPSDTNALTTMDAIMAYNRQLVARLHELEHKIEKQGEDLNDTVKDAVGDLKEALPHHDNVDQSKSKPKEETGDFTQAMPSYNKSTDTKGTNHSFEFPIGDALMGSGNFSTTPLEDEHKEEEPKKRNEDEETVKGEDDTSGGGIRISDGDKDDIVIKVEATKKGITFCIHIPRN
ncbi:hypothetical protein K501DRAFT_283834 [Backusella circina FSU 941]|nr:hypothetical protein K501DRAFT_283834 [Backusella circina FSU 941]